MGCPRTVLSRDERVIHGNHLNVVALKCGAHHQAANAAEAWAEGAACQAYDWAHCGRRGARAAEAREDAPLTPMRILGLPSEPAAQGARVAVSIDEA